jgi:DNA-binding MarR family transcriptional regulator
MASYHEMELLSRQVDHTHRAAVQAELNAAGLGEVGHPMLLSILSSACDQDQEGKCHAQRDLADMMHISPSAVANSLKSLERGGYIRREPGVRDARRNQIIVTPKGVDAVTQCVQIFDRVSQKMMSGFSQQETEQLMGFQRRMLDNLLHDPQNQTKKEES